MHVCAFPSQRVKFYPTLVYSVGLSAEGASCLASRLLVLCSSPPHVCRLVAFSELSRCSCRVSQACRPSWSCLVLSCAVTSSLECVCCSRTAHCAVGLSLSPSRQRLIWCLCSLCAYMRRRTHTCTSCTAVSFFGRVGTVCLLVDSTRSSFPFYNGWAHTRSPHFATTFFLCVWSCFLLHRV